MKRLLFFSILVTLLCGCNPAGNKGQDSVTDSIGVVSDDTIALEVPEDPAPEPIPEPEPPFTSQDLKWQQLQGHVKQLKIIGEYGTYAIFNYDRQGNFISYHDSYGDPYKIKRNKKGQIVEWHQWRDETDFYVEEKYYYNSDGYIYKDWLSSEFEEEESIYVLNEQGWPISASWKCDEEDDMGEEEVYYHKGTVFYTYSNIDDHGNWLKCVVKCKHPYFHNYTETRKITYWQ